MLIKIKQSQTKIISKIQQTGRWCISRYTWLQTILL